MTFILFQERVGEDEHERIYSVNIPPLEYILGVADLTGELMRLAINSVANGDLSKPRELCSLMRAIHDSFLSFGNASRDISHKARVLKQSLLKVENACYSLQVRGSELPQHLLKNVFVARPTETAGDADDNGRESFEH